MQIRTRPLRAEEHAAAHKLQLKLGGPDYCGRPYIKRPYTRAPLHKTPFKSYMYVILHVGALL